jgi:Ca2+-binding RTX toxin-like protein
MKARIHALGAVGLAATALMGVSDALAEARVVVGTSKSDNVTGTTKADTMRLGAGNDRARGRGGADRILGAAGKDRLAGNRGGDRLRGGGGDRLLGNAGRDRVIGGKGRDRLAGGAGNDYLNAADGRKDTSVNGGRGRNKCRIDAADLSVTKGCGSVTVAPPSASPTAPGSGPGGAPGGGDPGGGPGGIGLPGAPGAAGTITLVQGSGLQCILLAPSCTFSLTVDPGTTPLGEVMAELQVEANGDAALVGVSPLVQVGDNVVAGGVYVCTDAGLLVLVFRDQRIEVPVACDRP